MRGIVLAASLLLAPGLALADQPPTSPQGCLGSAINATIDAVKAGGSNLGQAKKDALAGTGMNWGQDVIQPYLGTVCGRGSEPS